MLGSIVSVIDGFGLVGAAKGIIEQTQKYIDKFVLDNDAKAALKSLHFMSERQIEDALPDFLAFDLNKASMARSIPVVLVLDTYEALWDNNTSERLRFSSDSWVRRLVQCLACSLTVIGGREKILWGEYENSWEEVVETHRLTRLSEEDVTKFLESAGIEEPKLRKQIQRVSYGHPYYLDLCLDTIAQEGEMPSSNWPETRIELFNRFARSLSDQELSLLKRLAPLRTYDALYANDAAHYFNIALDADEIRAHERFSFVKHHPNGKSLHDLMRRSIISQMTDTSLESARSFAFHHFNSRLKEINNSSFDTEIILPLIECSRQLRYLENTHLGQRWLAEGAASAVATLQVRASTGPILECLDTIAEAVDPSDWPTEIQIAYADVTHLVGRYRESVRLLKLLEYEDSETPTEINQKQFALVRRLHHSMMFRPLDKLWDEVERTINMLPVNVDARVLGEACFLIGGNLGAARGSKEDAWPWLCLAHGVARSKKDKALHARILRKVSDFLRADNDLERSRRVIQRAQKICDELKFRRYANYLDCSFADQLRLEGLTDDALQETRSVRTRLAVDNLDGWLGHTYLLEAYILLDIDRTEAASESLKSALAFYMRTDHLWGRLQCRMAQEVVSFRLSGAIDVRAKLDLVKELKTAGYRRTAQDASNLLTTKRARMPAIAFL